MAKKRNRRNSVITRLATTQMPWVALGSLETAQAALAVDERKLASVQAMASDSVLIFQVPEVCNNAVLRFRGGTDAQSNVLELYGGNYDAINEENASLSRIATITIVTGLHQVASTGATPYDQALFARTITISNEVFHKTLTAKTYADGSDDIGEVSFDLLGLEILVIIASTLNSDAVQVDFRGA